MSAPKFTPGEWRIKYADKRRKVLVCDVIDAEYRSVCSFFDSGHRDSTFANAQLCAAAPELYAALVDVLSPSRSDCNDRACGECSVCKARHALGKAVPRG